MLKIAKDAKECVQECVSEFISFITSEYPLKSLHHLFQLMSLNSLNTLDFFLHLFNMNLLNKSEIEFVVITWCIWVQSNSSNIFGEFEEKKAKKIQDLYKVKCSWLEFLHYFMIFWLSILYFPNLFQSEQVSDATKKKEKQ